MSYSKLLFDLECSAPPHVEKKAIQNIAKKNKGRIMAMSRTPKTKHEEYIASLLMASKALNRREHVRIRRAAERAAPPRASET